VGVIGCGSIARAAHLPLLRQLPGAIVVALAESDPLRLAEARRLAPGAAGHSDYHELLGMSDVEAVVIAVPTAVHVHAARAALASGKHVYLEKPLAPNLEGAEELVAAWRAAGVVGMIGFNYRFNTLFERARRHVGSGAIGRVVSVRTVFSTSGRGAPEWQHSRRTAGGALLELGSHHVDLISWLLARDVRAVTADVWSRHGGADSAVLQLALEDGVRTQSFFSFGVVEEDRVEIYGEAGKVTVDRYRSLDIEVSAHDVRSERRARLVRSARGIRRLPYLVQKLRSPYHEPSYRVALERFIGAIGRGEAVAPTFLDGYRSLAVIDAAERAATTGQRVLLEPGTGVGHGAPHIGLSLRLPSPLYHGAHA
jgi:predicted dehydrogenase